MAEWAGDWPLIDQKTNRMSKLSNEIEVHDRSITEVFEDKKYTLDYFQQEYKWEECHIEQLVSDFTLSFVNKCNLNLLTLPLQR